MRRIFALFLALALALSLSACRENTPEPTPSPTVEPIPTPESTVERDVLEVYQEALERLLTEHIDPERGYYEDYIWEDLGQIEFAVCDVDVDGEQELIMRHADTYMAEQYTAVYRYDGEMGELVAEFGGTASCRFYDNGTAQDDLSHNQGYSRRFWPFIAYEYNTQAKEYKRIQLVDAWELEFMKEAGMERDYPAEVDKEGVGFVYYFWDDETRKMSQREYNAWYDSIFGGAKEIEVDYQPLTEENLKKVCARAAYEGFLAGDMSLIEPVEPGWTEHLALWRDVLILPGEMEYTYLDLDGDGVDELLLQCPNDPMSYNGVFHYEDGTLQCWQHDEIEMICRDYPLRDGTMVRQYRESYYLFRYQPDGSREELADLAAMLKHAGEEGYLYWVDGEDVDKAEFERQLKRLVTDQLLEREAWRLVPTQQEDGK